jgi:hypothetical protein
MRYGYWLPVFGGWLRRLKTKAWKRVETMLQCSPELEEMERFAATVIKEGRIYETYSYT